MAYYIIVKHWPSADEYKIIGVPRDANPLSCRSGWDQVSGPLDTWECAKDRLDDLLEALPQ